MHVRFSLSVGTPVVSEDTSEAIGEISGILIHPDTAKVEGFFVSVKKGFLSQDELFLSSQDIVRWSTYVFVRHDDVLGPLEDLVRLQGLFEEGRPVLGQAIRSESGSFIGYCRDVQFDTLHFLVDWIFPKRFVSWGVALPVAEIVEVKPDAIIVKDPVQPAKEPLEQAVLQTAPLIPQAPEAA